MTATAASPSSVVATLGLDGDLWTPADTRAAAKRIIDGAQHVRVDTSCIRHVVDRLERWGATSWIHESPVQFGDMDVNGRLTVALVFNAVSFCYWPAPWWDNNWYGSEIRRGSWALLAAIRHAIDSGVPVLTPAFLSSLRLEDLSAIVSGRGRLAQLARRAAILREVGSVLERDFGGRFQLLVERDGIDAPGLVAAVLTHFPSFRDEACLDGCILRSAKRAQLLVADCHRVLQDKRGRGLTGFGSLTACADYMIPALLLREGILVYSPELELAIQRQTPLPAGGRFEIEIRAATIVACDLLAESWGKPAMEVNDALWLRAGEVFAAWPAHHRTWTEAY